MATDHVTVSVRFRDVKRIRLFVYELHELRNRMVVAASPFATDLDRLIDRFMDGGDDDNNEGDEE